MKCAQCHQTDVKSPTGDLLPVTFDQHCRKCHEEALGFITPDLTARIPNAKPSPHTGNVDEIRNIIRDTYTSAVAADPDLKNQRIGRDFVDPKEGLAKVIAFSEYNLFNGPKKCMQCHFYEEPRGVYPVVKKVLPIKGQFVPGKASGDPWLTHAKFSHRAHRAELCGDCHTDVLNKERLTKDGKKEKGSVDTADVLIPKMADCTRCHGSSGTHLDRCSMCHLYHNKKQELKKDRLPVDQLGSRGNPPLLPDPHLFARVGGAH